MSIVFPLCKCHLHLPTARIILIILAPTKIILSGVNFRIGTLPPSKKERNPILHQEIIGTEVRVLISLLEGMIVVVAHDIERHHPSLSQTDQCLLGEMPHLSKVKEMLPLSNIRRGKEVTLPSSIIKGSHLQDLGSLQQVISSKEPSPLLCPV